MQDIRSALRNVIDPEIGISVLDLGLVYGVEINDLGGAVVNMTLTTPTCPLTDSIESQIRDAVKDITVSCDVNWVWNPPWSTDFITEDGKKQLAAIGYNF